MLKNLFLSVLLLACGIGKASLCYGEVQPHHMQTVEFEAYPEDLVIGSEGLFIQVEDEQYSVVSLTSFGPMLQVRARVGNRCWSCNNNKCPKKGCNLCHYKPCRCYHECTGH